MASPVPKDPSQLRRRNVETSWRALDPDAPTRPAPPLPDREAGWSERTLEWWDTIWASPMSLLWLPADMGALHDLAEIRERFQKGDQTLGGSNAIRQLEDRLGLSPKSRQMLRWQLPRADATTLAADDEAPPKTKTASVTRLRAVDSG